MRRKGAKEALIRYYDEIWVYGLKDVYQPLKALDLPAGVKKRITYTGYLRRDVPPTPVATLRRARRIAHDAGLRHVYTGNVHDPEGQTTVCSSCGEALIVRDWYRIDRYAVSDSGQCGRCGAAHGSRARGDGLESHT